MEDIERAFDRLEQDRTSLSPHFMGALVISQIKTFGKQVQAYEVIDGQQRLTTFQLLLAALRDVAATNGSRYADNSKIPSQRWGDGGSRPGALQALAFADGSPLLRFHGRSGI